MDLIRESYYQQPNTLNSRLACIPYANKREDIFVFIILRSMALTLRQRTEIQLNDRTVTTLNLQQKWLGDAGAQWLSEALKTNTSITSLDLSANNIGAQGAQRLADALLTNSSIKELGLHNNNIGAEGMKWLSNALKTNSVITTLDLWYNKLGAKGCLLYTSDAADE